MDERVAALLSDFPAIFEHHKNNLEDLDNDWVVIDVTYEGDPVSPDDFLDDLGRFDQELGGDPDRSESSLPDIVGLPSDIDVDRGGLIEILRRRRPRSIDTFRRRIKGNFPGGPGGVWVRDSPVPPPDALAVYLPFHRYPDLWGIYLLDAGVASFATDIQMLTMLLGYTLPIVDARRVAQIYLFHHEAYHSAVEAFALRSELPLRKPVYRRALRTLYTRAWLPGLPHEETLATAYGIRKVRDEINLPKPLLQAIVQALRIYMYQCPGPYKAGVDFLDDTRFDELERSFIEDVLRLTTSKALPPAVWTMATFLMAPLLQRNRKYSWICDRANFRKRSRLAVHYFRQRDVLSCLERISGAMITGGGKHSCHLVREANHESGRRKWMSPVPSGEIHKGTLNAMLKQLGLDLNVEDFRNECRKAGKAVS